MIKKEVSRNRCEECLELFISRHEINKNLERLFKLPYTRSNPLFIKKL